jgi:hypothetical protein
MELTRFEFSFFGEYQNIGFIKGLKDSGTDDETIHHLIAQ